MAKDQPRPPESTSLQGRLLLADPAMRDPNFARAVVLLAEHDPGGAIGFILNRPLGRQVGELLPGGEFACLATVPVFRGGPVAIERLSFATLLWDGEDQRLAFAPHLTTVRAAAALLEGLDVRAFVGYAGWSPGQVEDELEAKAWIVAESGPETADPQAAAALWPAVLRRMGSFHELLSHTPGEPERN
jgi:putative transcriptional regulator